jgi:glycosyltransferase involved in cell wall biosynthesis
MPRLTILMPAYNAARFITEAVKSLLHQTFTDFELWVVNDASTDNTATVLSTFTDSRLHVFTHSVNNGRDALVNEWVQKINTPFFTVTDADDVSHPQRLQKQMEQIEADVELMMCGTSYRAIDEDGFLLRTVLLPADAQTIRLNLHKHAQFHGPTTVMRREVLDFVKPFYRSGYVEADADLCLRILSKHKASNCVEALYYYRVVRGSMSRSNVTPALLNSYSIIFWLYQKRISTGTDGWEEGNMHALEEYIHTINEEYTPALLHRHIAFHHLYWCLMREAIAHAWKARVAAPLHLKNYLALLYILLRSGLFSLNRAVNKKHYITSLSLHEG